MTYEEAIAYVIANNGAAFSFAPYKKNEVTVGGKMYILARGEWNRDDPEEYGAYTVHFVGGLFEDCVGEEESYPPEYVPEDAKVLPYERAACEGDAVISLLDYETQIVLRRLKKPREQWTDADLN